VNIDEQLRRRSLSPLGALLSYLVPGLGQICQGRFGKGLLFFFCLYGLFFYGMALGSWQNVYLPDVVRQNGNTSPLFRFGLNVYNRLPFAGQFWIGVAAWPALYQYGQFDDNEDTGPIFGQFERAPRSEETINKLQREGNKTWDLGWVYTVIAGVLNILVIYDALAGPAFAEGELRQRLEEGRA
jgi:TM2 domain-containing membrane protein YozV